MFLIQLSNVTLHPGFIVGMGDAEGFSNFWNKPDKADKRHRGENNKQNAEKNTQNRRNQLL